MSADEFVLIAPRRKIALLVAGSSVFTAAGVLMLASDEAGGWLVIIFFGLCLVVGIGLLLRPSRLMIDRAGMTSVHLWRHQRFEFADCSDFTTWRNPVARSQQLVVFDWTGVRHKSAARLSRGLAGRNSALPDTYGMNSNELAQLLNERRAKNRDLEGDHRRRA